MIMAFSPNAPSRPVGKVAVVTAGGGRGSGIGRAYASGLAKAGASAAGAGLNREGAGRVGGEIEEAGGKAIAVQVDIADEASVSAMMGTAEAAFGGLDILVNNAAQIGRAHV